MSSPFKFLDAFDRKDKAIFFGRSAEVEQLYRLVFEASLVLVYGVSGTGKTSLIQCGLANRFAETDWFQLFVRRTDDINVSLSREIRARAVTPIPDDDEPVEAIRSLYLDHLRPVYLIFDQFEELFILGSREEQDRFFETAAAIIASDVSCKIIISLREEYLASLHRFEEVVPTLFNKRLRVEPMSMRNVEEVIIGTTGALGIGLEHGEKTAELIIEQLEDERAGVQLAYLQVYLDSLYHQADGAGEPIVFTDAMIRTTGKLGDVMVKFLADQTSVIQKRLSASHPQLHKDAVAHLLEEFVTVDGTKQPTSREELVARLPSSAAWVDDALSELQAARILRNVGGRFELSHDSLAARICESRSGERRSMLMVQKMVRDRFAMLSLQKKKRYLDAEDLAIVNRGLRQRDPIRGTPLLELTADEQNFVNKSRWKLRFRRYRFILLNLVVLAVILFSFLGLILQASQMDDEAIAATHDFDRQAFDIFVETDKIGLGTDEDNKWLTDIRTRVLTEAAKANTNREKSLGLQGDDPFWGRLKDMDLLVDMEDEAKVAKGREGYLGMEQALLAQLGEDEDDLRARARLMSLQRRLYATDPEGPEETKRLRYILDLAGDPGEFPPVDFKADVTWACEILAVDHKQADKRCQR